MAAQHPIREVSPVIEFKFINAFYKLSRDLVAPQFFTILWISITIKDTTEQCYDRTIYTGNDTFTKRTSGAIIFNRWYSFGYVKNNILQRRVVQRRVVQRRVV